LREQLRDTIALYELTSPHEELTGATEDLAALIKAQARRLRDVLEPEKPPLRWDWSQATLSFLFAGLIAAICWKALWPNLSQWWAVAAVIPLAIVGLAFAAVGFQALFQRKSEVA
jgi:hypothetical protein